VATFVRCGCKIIGNVKTARLKSKSRRPLQIQQQLQNSRRYERQRRVQGQRWLSRSAGMAATGSRAEWIEVMTSDGSLVLAGPAELQSTELVRLRHGFLPDTARRACFREWRKGYNAAT
jgi:hypothetical protein